LHPALAREVAPRGFPRGRAGNPPRVEALGITKEASIDAFSIESRFEGDALRLVLAGEFRHKRVPGVTRALADAYRGHARAILLDLSGLTFMDTSALAALLQADARCRRDGILLRVSAPPPSITRLFQITGANALLDFSRES
jgi:anti-sigma B factor antagonist